MRILLDTNIIISREDYEVLDEDLNILFKIFNELNVEVLVHPKSSVDLLHDKDRKRKEIILSKFKTYKKLEFPPDPLKDKNFIKKVGIPKTENDIIDDFLLYAIYKDAVNFLVTEDKGIHKKSPKINIENRVLFILEAIDLLQRNILREEIKVPPAINKTTIANIDVNDPLFDTLRVKYPGFNKWFFEKSKNGRKCWYYKKNTTLGAILIYKDENQEINSIPPLPKKKRIKISTINVSYTGHKIGELFLKLSIELAIKNNISEIYLTHFTEEIDYLIDLIKEFGFRKEAVKKWDDGRLEDVYIKKIFIEEKEIKNLSPLEISNIYYPNFYDGIKVKKHIIPIRPEYHNRLFTDFPKRQTTLNEHAGKFIIEGNTIKKAYLCHAITKKIKPGALLIFYRSHDIKGVVSLGIAEKIFYNLTTLEEVANIVGKRSVYSLSEIEEITQRPTTVILFNHHFYFKRILNYKQLVDYNILRGPPQSIKEINHQNYLLLKEEGVLDERFAFN